MKIRVSSRKEKVSRDELLVDVSGLTEYEAQDFVDEVKRRVTIKSCRKKVRTDPCGELPRGRGTGRRQVIDVNINVIRD